MSEYSTHTAGVLLATASVRPVYWGGCLACSLCCWCSSGKEGGVAVGLKILVWGAGEAGVCSVLVWVL